MEASTCENANFRMPKYILSKATPPLNSHFERTMFTSKFFADFAMQNPFKVRSTQPDMSCYPFFAHFAFKKLCTAKSTQAIDVNQSTLHDKPYTLEKSRTFKDKSFVNAEIFYM